MKPPANSGKPKSLRDADMVSPAAIRNRTGTRKAKDMPGDDGYKHRDPGKDYAGKAAKDH